MSDDFAEFVSEVQKGMQRLALALTGGEVYEAQDLVQSSLERIWSRWGRLQIADPRAYARTVLAREFATTRRRARWKREHLISDPPEPQSGDFSSTSDQTVELLRVLARLPRRQREAVVLRHLEDMSVAEVASLLSCSHGAVKRSSFDGLRALRVMVEDTVERS